jgi:hypothetical protein
MDELPAYDAYVMEGEIRAGHRLLLRLGGKLLGPPDPAVEAGLTSIQDVERLDRMADAITSVRSWQELLSTP